MKKQKMKKQKKKRKYQNGNKLQVEINKYFMKDGKGRCFTHVIMCMRYNTCTCVNM